jgi:hypothetical protein
MTYVHKINLKCLHYAIVSLNEFTIQNVLFIEVTDEI